MSTKRKIEIFSAGCAACTETIELVNKIACPSCEITIFDMNDSATATRARKLGIHSVPAVLIDGKLASCCSSSGVDENALRAEGVGRTIA